MSPFIAQFLADYNSQGSYEYDCFSQVCLAKRYGCKVLFSDKNSCAGFHLLKLLYKCTFYSRDYLYARSTKYVLFAQADNFFTVLTGDTCQSDLKNAIFKVC